MGDEKLHAEITETVSRLTPLARDGSPDPEGAGVFGGITTRLRLTDGYETALDEAPLPPLRAALSMTLPDIPDNDYPFGHPLGILGNSIRYLLRDSNLAVELWSPLPRLDSQAAPAWLYWLAPRIDFRGYGADYSYTIDDGTVRFAGGLRHGNAWGKGITPVYAAEGEPPRVIEPMPAGSPLLGHVTTAPPPHSVDWRERLIRTATNPLGE
ncbi:hypothetical protein ACH4SK_11495 [Streptomyces inhibens]|uniref:hypothetical protein n=1 Tax=Streptomyces inhibens TaxID=2293571 RepID=UPI00379CD497